MIPREIEFTISFQITQILSKYTYLLKKINFQSINNNNYNIINYIYLKYSEKLNLWHRRMAHFNIDSIKNKLLKIHIPTTCPFCANSKLKKKKKKKKKINLSKIPLMSHT